VKNVLIAPTCVVALLALSSLLALAGCKSVGLDDVTGSIAVPAAPASASPEEVQKFSESLGQRYEAHPDDKALGLAYARSLRARELNEQAAAVLQQLAIRTPRDRDVLAAYGKALADAGQLRQAQGVLEQADTPDNPNWSVVSTRASIADRLGDHAAAQSQYETALKLAPGEPSVLSNLGLSYALSRDLFRAEQALNQAAASPRADSRIRQNLALVLVLQGKTAEAEQISARDLPPAEAKENVAALRKMIAQSDTWRDIQTQTGRKPKADAAAG
jgi:Flp pilus assembly protein TadD